MLYASEMDVRLLLVSLSMSGLAAQSAVGAESIYPCPTFEAASVNCFPSEAEPEISSSGIKSEDLEDFADFQHCDRRMSGRLAPSILPISEETNSTIVGSTEDFECAVDLRFEISRWGRVREIDSSSECPDITVLERAAIESLESSRFRKGIKTLNCTHTITFKLR